jgi:hypothetical protein
VVTVGEPVLTRNNLAARLEAVLWSLADPAPAAGLVEPTRGSAEPAALAGLLVRRGAIDWELADAVLEVIREVAVAQAPGVLARLAGVRDLAERFEEHVLGELGRLPSWYRVRISDPDRPAGAWVERDCRSLRVEVRGADGPWSGAVGRAVVDEPVLLIVPGEPPDERDVEVLRRRHARLEFMSWDVDGGRLQQLIERGLAGPEVSAGPPRRWWGRG